MRRFGLALLGFAVLGVASCESNVKNMVVGKWEPASVKDRKDFGGPLEFTEDGEVFVTVGDKRVKGTYTIGADRVVELERKDGEETQTLKFKIKSITKKEMEVVAIKSDHTESKSTLLRKIK